MKLKILAIVSAVAFSFSSFTSLSAADVPDEQFVVSSPPGDVPSFGVVIEDSQKLKNTFSTLQAFTSDGNQIGTSKVLSVDNCFEYGTVECGQDKFMNFMASLGYCSQELTAELVAVTP